MAEDWKTPRQPRLVGHVNDASGDSVAFLQDRDVVLIQQHGLSIRIGPDERETFVRWLWETEAKAEAWEKEHAEAVEIPIAGLVEAEVWCALDGGCLQGPPGSHLFGPACVTEAEAAGLVS